MTPSPEECKVAENSADRRDDIPFFDQNPNDKPSNLSRQFLAFNDEGFSGLTAEGEEDKDGYPGDEGGGDGDGERGDHG